MSVERIEALERLARLIELYEATEPKPTKKRWPIVLVLICTLLLGSILLYARRSETEIELDVVLSKISFIFPTHQRLTEALNLSSLGISGPREVQLPRAKDRVARTLSFAEGESAVNFSVSSQGNRQGSVTLADLVVAKDAQISVSRADPPHQYRLYLQTTDEDVHVDVNGPLQIAVSEEKPAQLDFVTPQAVLLKPSANGFKLDIALLDSTKSTFAPQLKVSSLSFLDIDENRDLNDTFVRQLSTITAGTLTFESLNGLERKLRDGEMLQFEITEGEIRRLHLDDGKIMLRFHGRVRDMSIGSGENRRSLMPTWLEWLRARHSLSLLWATALYLFGLIAGALRWWRSPS